ncbi:hypothetical protein [Haloarcula nitratireducens]|uniref:Uncharacterized protein n=1 Tax=Haloarcula nitratireducens TaxID=2487749 RepID=A0AAW4PDH5_9EURY|nr:hypothetical protein [Halomicroarcula nitratireducens]MBX0295713.1 hypothetical protein [Halomicroarcula nitratireducens]
MDERKSDAERVTDAIEDVGVDRLTDAIVDAWERAGLDTGTPTWPDDEPLFRVRPPVSDEDAGLDALAAVLDTTPRRPETAFCYLDRGRRADLVGPGRVELEALSGHADVTVDADHTAGTVPFTPQTFDALATLFDELSYLVVRDADDVAIAEWRAETLRFALPESGLETVKNSLDAATADRIERAE